MPMRATSVQVIWSGSFCGILLASLILSAKIATWGGLTFPASVILFPATFLISDALTEVYGFAAARRVIWTGLLVELVWIASYMLSASLAPASVWPGQSCFVATLGPTPRIAIGGMAAYVVGELLNAYVLSRLRARSKGRALALRLVVSTFIGTGADTLIVIVIAFGGVYPVAVLVEMAATVWALKVLWEVAALPISVPLIRWLGRVEPMPYR